MAEGWGQVIPEAARKVKYIDAEGWHAAVIYDYTPTPRIPEAAAEALARVLAEEALFDADCSGSGWNAETDSSDHFMPRARKRATEYLAAAAPHMARVITTVDELEALPVGSIVAMIGSEPQSPSVACRAVRGWQFLGDDPERRYLSSSLMPSPEPITVLHEPEATRG